MQCSLSSSSFISFRTPYIWLFSPSVNVLPLRGTRVTGNYTDVLSGHVTLVPVKGQTFTLADPAAGFRGANMGRGLNLGTPKTENLTDLTHYFLGWTQNHFRKKNFFGSFGGGGMVGLPPPLDPPVNAYRQLIPDSLTLARSFSRPLTSHRLGKQYTYSCNERYMNIEQLTNNKAMLFFLGM